jgi:hypothetical protein
MTEGCQDIKIITIKTTRAEIGDSSEQQNLGDSVLLLGRMDSSNQG